MVADQQGHRTRLRARFTRGGIRALHDYEILELLLSYVIPRQDTKPRAKALLKRFKTINGVLQAPSEQLLQLDDIGPGVMGFLSLLRETAAYCLREQVEKRHALTHRQSVEDYLRFAFGSRSDEHVVLLFLDAANSVLSAEVIAEGTVNQCAIYPRSIIGKAITAGAAGMIMAHNHPGGTASPSEADWSLTRRLHEIGTLLDIALLDHLVVCRDQVLSLREMPRWPR